jgi:aspartyl-tRNA(Asn)/glutamyl-tRNA(Gln) amidotransferase subunit C
MNQENTAVLRPDDVLHLARLARLELSEEEIARYSPQLSSVVAYVEQVGELAVSRSDGSVAPSGLSGQYNVLAADTPRADSDLLAVDSSRLVGEAPVHDRQFFAVRAVLGEENGGSA